MVKTSVYLQPEVAVALRELARSEEKSQAELIREALKIYVKRVTRAKPVGLGRFRSGRSDVSVRHRLSLDLPKDFPARPAEVIVLAAPEKSRRVVRVAGVLSPDAPVPAHDPIGETLQEMREKRT